MLGDRPPSRPAGPGACWRFLSTMLAHRGLPRSSPRRNARKKGGRPGAGMTVGDLDFPDRLGVFPVRNRASKAQIEQHARWPAPGIGAAVEPGFLRGSAGRASITGGDREVPPAGQGKGKHRPRSYPAAGDEHILFHDATYGAAGRDCHLRASAPLPSVCGNREGAAWTSGEG